MDKKEYKPLKVWFGDSKQPREFKDSLDLQKSILNLKLGMPTSASIEIVEKVTPDEGNNLQNLKGAQLRHWALVEIQNVQKVAKNLDFMDVKYRQVEYSKADPESGEVKTYAPRLIYRVTSSKKTEESDGKPSARMRELSKK